MRPKGTRWAGIIPGARPNWPHVEPISALAETQAGSYGAVRLILVRCPSEPLLVRAEAETLTVRCPPEPLLVRAGD